MAADQLRGERLAQRDGAGDGAVGVVRVIDRNVDALVHRILRMTRGQLTLAPASGSAVPWRVGSSRSPSVPLARRESRNATAPSRSRPAR